MEVGPSASWVRVPDRRSVKSLDSLVELREVHLVSATDLLASLQRAIHSIPGRFRDALPVYGAAMGEDMLVVDVGLALLAAGLTRVHANAIGARAEERDDSHNALLTRWGAYQVATEVLTHEVDQRVSPERARGFERMATGGCGSKVAGMRITRCEGGRGLRVLSL